MASTPQCFPNKSRVLRAALAKNCQERLAARALLLRMSARETESGGREEINHNRSTSGPSHYDLGEIRNKGR